MRIKRGHHAVDGRVDQLRVLDFAYIVRTHPFKGISEQIKFAVRGQDAGRTLRRRKQSQCTDKSNRYAHSGECELSHVPFAFLSSALIHGAGSTAWPLRLSSRYSRAALPSGRTPTGSPASTRSPICTSMRPSPANVRW